MSWFLTNKTKVLNVFECLLKDKSFQVRVFGSALRIGEPNDIDVLVIAPDNMQHRENSFLKKTLKSLRDMQIDGRPINILLLTEAEINNPGRVVSNILSKSTHLT